VARGGNMTNTYEYIFSIQNVSEIEKWIESPASLIFRLNGDRMLTLEDCYTEFAKKLNFPEYFGYNLNALNDMITDLSWLDFQSIHIFIENAYLFLVNEQKETREVLFDILESAGESWAKPVQLNEIWDRNSVDFKVFLVLN
jgi:RNAse (barnase) inhibitor barstar